MILIQKRKEFLKINVCYLQNKAYLYNIKRKGQLKQADCET